MSGSNNLLCKLLDYVVQSTPPTDLQKYNLLSLQTNFLKYKADLNGLPGINFDIKEEGDHIWVRVDRLKANPPPQLLANEINKFILIDDNPHGNAPCVNEIAFKPSLVEYREWSEIDCSSSLSFNKDMDKALKEAYSDSSYFIENFGEQHV